MHAELWMYILNTGLIGVISYFLITGFRYIYNGKRAFWMGKKVVDSKE